MLINCLFAFISYRYVHLLCCIYCFYCCYSCFSYPAPEDPLSLQNGLKTGDYSSIYVFHATLVIHWMLIYTDFTFSTVKTAIVASHRPNCEDNLINLFYNMSILLVQFLQKTLTHIPSGTWYLNGIAGFNIFCCQRLSCVTVVLRTMTKGPVSAEAQKY